MHKAYCNNSNITSYCRWTALHRKQCPRTSLNERYQPWKLSLRLFLPWDEELMLPLLCSEFPFQSIAAEHTVKNYEKFPPLSLPHLHLLNWILVLVVVKMVLATCKQPSWRLWYHSTATAEIPKNRAWKNSIPQAWVLALT